MAKEQKNKMICITLPWTDSEYTQLKGRIYRQGSEFDSVFTIFSQLPEGFKEDPSLLNEIDYQPPSMVIVVLLSLFSYILIDRGIFGSDIQVLVEKNGVGGYFLRKISLMGAIIFVSLLLQFVALLIII